MRNVTKEIFLNAVACPTLGWLLRCDESTRQFIEELRTLGDQFLMEQGLEIHNRARQLYPDGILVQRRNYTASLQETMRLMKDPNVLTIFEATFLIDDYAAKADILRRNGKAWHLIEVKSSANDKEEFLDDMAYTTIVIQHAGFKVNAITLLLVSRDYRLGMPNENLFVGVNHTGEVLAKVELFDTIWDQIKEITGAQIKPDPEIKIECKNCPIFTECLGKGIDNHILEIPRLHKTKFDSLKESGIVCIEDIPNGFPLTDNQARVRNCVMTGKPFVSSQLRSDLAGITWPAFYLDFETVRTAIPLYPDIAPYTQLPTQYSIHKYANIGQEIDHRAYLADPSRDCRRELAESLIRDLEDSGSIIIYSSFDKTVINSLAMMYSDLSDKISALIERIVDLEVIIRKNFYHPDFHGSTSIKQTLPALVPELSYDALEIADGNSANAAFAYLAMGRYAEGTEAESVKMNLLEYCKQDSLGMVKLHEKLYQFI